MAGTIVPSREWRRLLSSEKVTGGGCFPRTECKNESMKDFEILANQHKDAVYRQMVRVCGNREDAEDVLIEALLKAYRNLDRLRDAVAFRSWLGRIASRVCWQLKQREALLPLLQLSALEEEGREVSLDEPSAEQKVAARQMKQMLDDAIRSLPELYGQVYKLRDIE